jgi:hypothetical protein
MLIHFDDYKEEAGIKALLAKHRNPKLSSILKEIDVPGISYTSDKIGLHFDLEDKKIHFVTSSVRYRRIKDKDIFFLEYNGFGLFVVVVYKQWFEDVNHPLYRLLTETENPCEIISYEELKKWMDEN